MKFTHTIMVTLLIMQGCNNSGQKDLSGTAKKQILAAEEAFSKAVKEKGEKIAFLEFADDSAAIKRGSRVFIGKKGIAECYDRQAYSNIIFQWKPDYVDASSSGDLGYTYGKFSFSAIDSAENKIEVNGIFHTVWKKQSDGSWKYVFD